MESVSLTLRTRTPPQVPVGFSSGKLWLLGDYCVYPSCFCRGKKIKIIKELYRAQHRIGGCGLQPAKGLHRGRDGDGRENKAG